MRDHNVTVFKFASTALASASVFAMSTATVFAMGGGSSRPGEAARGMGGGVGGGASSGTLPSMSNANPGMGNGNGMGNGPGGNVASVPEIDASTGLLAMAAVLAIVAFMWERNRRQKA
jgi:hypothetical protein